MKSFSDHYGYELFISIHHKQAQCILGVACNFLIEVQLSPSWELPGFLLVSSFSRTSHALQKAVPAAAAGARASAKTNLQSCLDSHAGSSILSGNLKKC